MAFWDVTSYSVVDEHHYFVGACCLHLPRSWRQHVALKCLYPHTKQKSATTQKTVILTPSAVRILQFTWNILGNLHLLLKPKVMCQKIPNRMQLYTLFYL